MQHKIKNLKPKSRIFLAPMLEPNDIAFRLLCKKAGCGLTYIGMTSPLSKKKLILDDKPAVQLFTNSTKGIKSFIKKYDRKVSLWDFNLGCPSKLSEKLKHGAFMQNNLPKIKKILQTIKNSTKKPITIKLRKSKNTFKIAKLSKQYVDAIAIHPRTTKQGYSGKPDYKFALKLKESVSIPIIYSGNADKNNLKKILKDFDFVFIGRKAIGNPNIFSSTKSKINFNNYLRLAKKYNLSFRQIKFQAMNFTKGMKNAKKLRNKLTKSKTTNEIKQIMQNNK